MKTFVIFILSMFGFKPKTEFHVYMKKARGMVKIAKSDKAQGFHCAAQAALDSAKHYRAAAHAYTYYSNKA